MRRELTARAQELSEMLFYSQGRQNHYSHGVWIFLVAAAASLTLAPFSLAEQNAATPLPNNAAAAAEMVPGQKGLAPAESPAGLLLGPGDVLIVWAADAPEISGREYAIDSAGQLVLPLVGRIPAAGLTPEKLEVEICKRLAEFILEPQAAVTIKEFHSQPVSVFGYVGQPGVHQLRGRKTLVEVLSLAGGIKDEAGYTVKITRDMKWGPLPLPGSEVDPSGRFSVGQVPLRAISDAESPELNIEIRPNDVITVPRGKLVYVIGEVGKAGGYVLGDQEHLSILQALSLAGGVNREGAPHRARILRQMESGGGARTEIAVDVKKILNGKSKDMPLEAEDILFVPGDTSKKKAGMRAAETAISTLTGIVIFRGGRF